MGFIELQKEAQRQRAELQNQRAKLKRQIADRLKHYRDGSKMTQLELSDITGLERTTITNIERGTQNMTIEQVIIFCAVFDITPNDILLGSEEHSEATQ